MQTPRGFLIGAGVIAAIAALTSIGHPHTETAVEATAPLFSDAIQETTTSATTTDPQTRVLAEHVEAGMDVGAGAAGALGASTTIELSNADRAPASGDGASTPAASNRQDSAAPTAVDAHSEEDRAQPRDAVVDSASESTSPATTLALTTTAAPPTAPPPTTLAPTTTVPPTTTAPSVTRVTLPNIDVHVPPVTLPQVVVPTAVVPATPTPPK